MHGWVQPSVSEVRKRIFIDSQRYRCSVSESGIPAYTEVATLAYFAKAPIGTIKVGGEVGEERYSLVALRLHTGRTHQIRVHMSAIS